MLCLDEEKNAIKYLKLRIALIPHIFYESSGDAPDQSILYTEIKTINQAVAFVGGKPLDFIKDFLHGKIYDRELNIKRVRNYQEKSAMIESLRVIKDGFELPSKEEVDRQVRETFITLTTAPNETNPVEMSHHDIAFPGNEWRKLKQRWGKVLSDDEVADIVLYNPSRPARYRDPRTWITSKCQTEFSEESAKIRLRWIVKQIFQKEGSKVTNERRLKAPLPSQNANYVASKRDGGAFAHIVDHLQDLSSEHDELDVNFTKQLVEMTENSYVSDGKVDEILLSSIDDLTTQYCYEKAMQEKVNDVDLVGLSEPLKVRVISKENPWITTANKVTQQVCWRALYEGTYGICDFIGRVINEKDLEKMKAPCDEEDLEACSIDYSQATKLLKSWATDTVVEALIEYGGFNESEREMLLLSLTKHDIHYKDLSARQQRGQLMGSITSFPILCIINLMVCHWALENNLAKALSLKETADILKINGDDGLLLGRQGLYNWWKITSGTVGFEPSLGKVVVTRKSVARPGKFVCQMNNTTYKIDFGLQERTLTFERIPKINSGILQGRTEIGRTREQTNIAKVFDDKNGIAQAAEALLQGLPRDVQRRSLDMYIKNMIEPHFAGSGIPWYIPCEFGGLGLPMVDEYHCPSWKDLNCLSFMLREGYGEEVKAVRKSTNPNLMKLVMKREPKGIKEKELVDKTKLSEYENNSIIEREDKRKDYRAQLLPYEYWWQVGKALREKLDFSTLVIPKDKTQKAVMTKVRKYFKPNASNQNNYLKDKFGDTYEGKMKYLNHLLNDFTIVDSDPILIRQALPIKNIVNKEKWADWDTIINLRNTARLQLYRYDAFVKDFKRTFVQNVELNASS